ncbi:siderophore-interacting protein [Galbitalea sp. SE-J8]|uniref:siderophore-interacting protein n=1 Tax=Galbitalea sp. SE-J8 TaxID=3054952 RepID=UPI00259CE653|nr:siderophore-interacting protein [Galbitalea sp. SE-J8]MDM4762198.1 siderophore-interacting protein [Galbitalea sp. SE-J8]
MGFENARRASTLCRVAVTRAERISPNFIRVTVAGDELAHLADHGFDHWFRLFLPQEGRETSFDLPDSFGMGGYVKYLRMSGSSRPHLRNYTVRALRPAERELDIDFVVHGDEGVAGRWVQRAAPGDRVALIDQAHAYGDHSAATEHLIAGDETALPAIANILRDLPRDARGLAIVELPDAADAQPLDPPPGIEVRELVRRAGDRPGSAALAEVQRWRPATERPAAYLVGEQALAAGGRRHAVAAGVPKNDVVFTGYWKLGRAH